MTKEKGTVDRWTAGEMVGSCLLPLATLPFLRASASGLDHGMPMRLCHCAPLPPLSSKFRLQRRPLPMISTSIALLCTWSVRKWHF
ncbi:hypothetical protein GUJ93_ZPchr0006g44959 [Zizania palustris]|uniref:Uncharacterized protein n=1 Tax=Zizania palustris TaxID=103762 RepID=A0A8J5SPD4_ZIZPA|nr:hypothetical protein GUJ93_ZPchr0006g44959 [Zizania palustris]